ncbi:hypothetical protein [Enterobacter bugandensis]|uniref:hypothetical protein n=1 Tax=Enterobacter bugandensis TaxID=881260 RepID=UPI0022DF8516|nr:hypothetical protein [Enterobacter bugandensis]
MYKIIFLPLLCGCLLSCSSQTYKIPHQKSENAKYININKTVDIPAIKPNESHLTQCNRDLESLRTISITEYNNYMNEYDSLMKSSAGFLSIKDDVSPEVAELARPKFQFALANLCYRIKDSLAQTLIRQAGGQ